MDIQRKEFEKWYFNENYKDTTACKLKVFEVLSGLVGVESPYNGTYLNYNVQTSWKVWQQAQKVAVPEPTKEVICAIENTVEDQLIASGITSDPFRLDGEKIYKAMIEAQEQVG